MNDERLLNIINCSSGTIANITGIKEYQKIDNFINLLVRDYLNNNIRYSNLNSMECIKKFNDINNNK